MSISKKEIDELKKSYESKVSIFDLMKNGKNKEATNLLREDSDALSYFMKFKSEDGEPEVIGLSMSGTWHVIYHSWYENKILTDLNKIKKEIEEK